MEQILFQPGERVDRQHFDRAFGYIESALRAVLRVVASGTYSSGTVAGLAVSWNVGTRTFTFDAGGVAVDASCNPILVPAGTVTSQVASALVANETVPLYIWCAVQLGTTPTSVANRIKNIGSGELSFAGASARADQLSFVISALQPGNLVNPTGVYFKTHEIIGWAAGVPEVVPKPLWYYKNPAELGVGGSVVGELGTLAAALVGILGDATYPTDEPAITLAELEGLPERVTADEAAIAALEAVNIGDRIYLVETPTRNIPIGNGRFGVLGSGVFGPDGMTFATGTTSVYRIGLDVPDTNILYPRRIGTCRVVAETDSDATLLAVVTMIHALTGVETAITDTATFAPGTAAVVKLLAPLAALAHEFDLTTYRYELRITATCGVNAAILRSARLNID